MPAAVGPFIGYGSDFQDSAVGGSGYASVGHCIDIDTPDVKVGDQNASYVQMATADMLFIPKLRDNGDVKFKLIWSPSVYSHVLGLIRTSPYYFKLVFPDLGSTASTLTFSGYYKEISAPMPLEDMVVCEVTIKVSGAMAFTSGT